MNGDYKLKTTALGLICLGLIVVSTSGCKCCPPCIDLSVSRPLQIWTWDPVTRFPMDPNKEVIGSKLQGLSLYLAKVKVTNNSETEDIRGAIVSFTWAARGLFDRGTAVGPTGVDLLAGETKEVCSPWFPTIINTDVLHRCFSARVFHQCDKNPDNNWCQRNIDIWWILRDWRFLLVPFWADFAEVDGPLQLNVDAPSGVRAYVVREGLPEGPADSVKKMAGIESLTIQPGVPQELSLVLQNAGAAFKPGDRFDVTVSALQDNKQVSSYTVQVEVRERG